MLAEKKFDEILSDRLIESGKVHQQAILASSGEAKITGESLATALVRNGFIKQNDVVDVILQIDPDALTEEDAIAPHVPAYIFKDYKIMIAAITTDTLYLATMKSQKLAETVLAPYFPQHEIKFVPLSMKRYQEYIEMLSKVDKQSEGENLEALLRKAIQDQVSDVHIMPNYDTYSISRRILGVKYIEKIADIIEYNPLVAQIKDRAKMDLAETRIPQDGSFSIDYNGRFIDFRIATVPAQYGETVIIRVLDPENAQVNLDSLGISAVEEWRKGMSRANGLCLICGPTGSGKTTTLNSTMKELDRFGKAIFSVEDPVEYKLPYVTQVSANKMIGLDFQDAVKAFMRSDPDIIIVGEVRDLNTAQNMMRAAETGHLVFATLHTETIRGAISRLRDIGIDEKELKYVLRTIMVQNLMRTPCKNCWGKGCIACEQRGYTGRTVVSECVYVPNQKVAERIIEGTEEDRWWDTIIEDAYKKYDEGITTEEELIRMYGEEGHRLLSEGYVKRNNEAPK